MQHLQQHACLPATCVPFALQAIAAVQTLNGAELGGRRISVREDREDRDVKQFTEGEEGGNGGFRRGGGRRGRGRGPRPPVEGDPSGYQVRRSCWCCATWGHPCQPGTAAGRP